MSGEYNDIIHLPHHVSKTRPQMPAIDRAAQFAPFAALTGHGAAIAEAGRLTEQKAELTEDEQGELNRKLYLIGERLSEHLSVKILYFKPDERKSGGAYFSVSGNVKKLDEYEQLLIFESGEKIPFGDIMEIDIPSEKRQA